MKNQISYGNKTIGMITFVSVIIIALIFSIILFNGYLLIATFFLVLMYSFQTSKIYYIKVMSRQFIIENVFKGQILKDLEMYKKVSKIGFGNLMKIEFSDNSKYYFWGESVKSIDRYVRQIL